MLCLELRNKKPWLGSEQKEHSPEELAGVFDRTFFLWLNGLFRKGYRRSIGFDDLASIDHGISSVGLGVELNKSLEVGKGMFPPLIFTMSTSNSSVSRLPLWTTT